MGLLNNPLRGAHTRPMRHRRQHARECSKKSVQQGRSLFDARSVHGVRERERREERHVCEPEGRQKGENAAGGFFQHSPNFQLPLLADLMQANHAPFMLRPFDELRIQHERGVAGFTPWRNGRSP